MKCMRLSMVAFLTLALAPATMAHAQSYPSPAQSLGLFPSPGKNQSEKQQLQDENACYSKAQQQAGASAAAQPQVAPPASPGARGAARGAAGGAAVGAIAGNAGTGAAVGATAGAVRGRRQSHAAAAQAGQSAQNAVKRAFSSCMEARGYAVK
jgi:hypothetical protein